MSRRPHVLRSAALAAFMLWACNTGAAQPDDKPYPNTDGFGVEFTKDEDWYRHCMRVRRPAPPPKPASAATTRCDATDLYYRKRDQKTASEAEWQAVRACAEASGNDSVLMMLHANGYGTARDTGLAIHYACKLDTAKAEMEGRVGYLATRDAAERQPFDLCDHITSGRMGGVCAAIGEGRAGRTRAARLERFAASLTPRARQPFVQLRQAADAFALKSVDEVDMSGTGAAGFAIVHEGRRHDEFMATLLAAASGKLPRANAAQLTRLDRQLNLDYRKLLARPSKDDNHPERIGYSTVTRGGVRGAERAWLAYRDAWAAYLAASGSPTDALSIKAALTRQRIAQLARI